MHNSNPQPRQLTLSGELSVEFKFYVLGFVRAEDLGLEEDVWFDKLNPEQVAEVEKHLAGAYRM